MDLETVIIKIYGPSFIAKPSIVTQLLDIIETLYPTKELSYTMLSTGKLKRIKSRNKRIVESIENDQSIPVLLSGINAEDISMQGYCYPMLKGFSELDYSYIFIEIPCAKYYLQSITKLIEGMGDKTAAFWITADTRKASSIAADQTIHNKQYKEMPYGLPPLPNRIDYGIRIDEIPGNIGWINFWSSNIADNIGLEYPEAQIYFHHVNQTSGKNWLLQLTEYPTDVQNDDHLEKLLNVYTRYNKVGGQDLLST